MPAVCPGVGRLTWLASSDLKHRWGSGRIRQSALSM